MKNRYIGVTHLPIIIVGECPGRQRKKDTVDYCFHGNRTGDFIESVIEGKTNIILTNANQFPKKQDDIRGFLDLDLVIDSYHPVKIICLGQKAKRAMEHIGNIWGSEIVYLDHPSYRLRFNKDIEDYKQQLLNELA